jgi:hypothetical protein
MEMLSQPMPYTTLLPIVSKMLAKATLMIPDNKSRKVTRVGVVSTTTVHVNEAPPGIGRFIEAVGRPWKGYVDNFSFQIIAVVGNDAKWTDRCIHTLVKPENSDGLLNLVFDWQRTFSSRQTISENALEGILSRAEKDALQYFEDVAEGSRFDADLNSATA